MSPDSGSFTMTHPEIGRGEEREFTDKLPDRGVIGQLGWGVVGRLLG